MKRLAAVLAAVLGATTLALVAPAPASAQPGGLSPANGGSLTVGAESFSWGDGQSDSLRAWYVEISTSPAVDYYPYGFFSGTPIYSSPTISSTSLNLGSTLAPGTYYWHVLGKYGLYGANGTAWSPVQSFVVASNVPAPTIDVSPTSLHFTVKAGDATNHAQSVAISNTGGGTLNFQAAANATAPQWLNVLNGTQTSRVYTAPIQVNASGLGVNRYVSFFRVWDSGSSPASTNAFQDVYVTLDVVPADTAPPTGSAVTVSPAGATRTTSVTLHTVAYDAGSGMGQMSFSNDHVTWSPWQPYATATSWQLPPTDGAHTVWARFRDNLGNAAAAVSTTVVLDRAAPHSVTLTSPPVSTPLSAAPAVVLTWGTSVDPAPGSGIAGYRIRSRTLPSGAWTAFGGTRTAHTATFPAVAGATYDFDVRAVDRAGNVSAASLVTRTTVPLDQTSASFATTWTTVAEPGAYRGTIRRTSVSGASATLTRIARTIGIVVTTGPLHGKLAVSVDGTTVRIVDTRTTTTRHRVTIVVKAFGVARTHTVRVINLATPGRAAIELDGIVAGL